MKYTIYKFKNNKLNNNLQNVSILMLIDHNGKL